MSVYGNESVPLDARFSLAITILNSVLSVLTILVAVYANHCLLAHDDARRWRAATDQQEDQEEPHNRYDEVERSETEASDGRSRERAPEADEDEDESEDKESKKKREASGRTDFFDYFHDARVHDGALGSPLLVSPVSPLARGPWLPPLFAPAADGASSGASAAPSAEKGSWGIFGDMKSVLFMLAIACSLAQAITLLALTLTDMRHLNSVGSRKVQDYIALIQAQLFFLYFTVLCVLLFRFGDVSNETNKRRFCLIMWGAVGGLFTLMFLALALALLHVMPSALELYGTVCQAILAFCFIVIAIVIPKRIVRYGETLAPVATKVRRVTLTTALALTVRLIILLPIVQNSMSVFGPFATPIFFVLSIVPVAASLHLLHSRVEPVVLDVS